MTLNQSSFHISDRFYAQLIFILATIFILFGAYQRSGADPAFSRLATVYSLVHRGTFFIDTPAGETPIVFEQKTIDKVMVRGTRIGNAIKNGRLISSKPPVLTLFMTVEYWFMKMILGWSLDNKEDVPIILMWMTITLVGGAYIGTLFCFYKLLEFYKTDLRTQVFLLFCLGFCTQLWGYSTLFNNHVPATFFVVLSIYISLKLYYHGDKISYSPWLFFTLGLVSSLAFTIDLPSAAFSYGFMVFPLLRYPRKTIILGGLGATLPLTIHFGITYFLTGSLLPVQTDKSLYWFESSYWRTPIQIDALNHPKTTYFFHMTVGKNGIFSLYPVLTLGLVGMLKAIYSRNCSNRKEILHGFFLFAIVTIYYLFNTNNYGGEAYGFRWYIPSMPVLLFMGAPVLQRTHKKWQWLFIALVTGISFYSAWEATKVSWAANQEWTSRFLGKYY